MIPPRAGEKSNFSDAGQAGQMVGQVIGQIVSKIKSFLYKYLVVRCKIAIYRRSKSQKDEGNTEKQETGGGPQCTIHRTFSLSFSLTK